MKSFSLIAALLLSSIASINAQCRTFDDGFRQYDVRLCPLANRNVPVIPDPIIFNPNIAGSVTGSNDQGYSAQQYNLSWPVNIYGLPHTQVYIGVNGALFFGTVGVSSDNLAIPVSTSNGNILPILAPLWTDQIMMPNVGIVQFGTIGSAGSRQQIIRYSNINPWTSTWRTSSNWTYDVVFFENDPSLIEFRYYNLTNAENLSGALTVGIQSWDDGAASFTFASANSQWAVNAPTLLGNALSFRYVGVNLTDERCAGLGYSFESIRGSQLSFNDGSNTWLYSPCGRVTDPRCANNPATDKAMICQIPASGSPVDLGVYGPGTVKYEYPAGSSTGVNAVLQSGSYCSAISATRLSTISYECDPAATSPSLFAATMPYECVYQLRVRTSLACGAGSRGNDTNVLFPASTLSFCNRVGGLGYDATLCPRSLEQRRAPDYGPMTPVLVNTASGVVTIPLQFPVWLYANSFQQVIMNVNSGLYFGNAPTATHAAGAAPNMGMSNANSFPMIIPFGASLSTLTYAGLNQPNITHTHTTINGRRAFVVRYWNMKFTSFRGLYDMVASWDVILTEAPTGQQSSIEIKYYRVTANAGVNVQIGMHGPYAMDTYTSYWNSVPVNGVFANQLTGASLFFNYSGRTSVDACAAYGLNFSTSMTQDLRFNDSSYTYLINPCGPLRNPAPCSAGTAVCQYSTNTPSNWYVLGVANPAAVTWSLSPDAISGIRSTMRDGAFCSTNARIVNLDWVCSKTTAVPTLVSMTEVATCVYNGVIYTPQVCLAEVACTNVSSLTYSGRLCPAVAPRVIQTTPTRIFTAQEDDDAIRVAIPFEFQFYGQYYRNVWIGTNGLLAFGPSKPSLTGRALPLTGANLDYTPIIAAFFSDINFVEQSYAAYSTQIVDGRRAFVVRFQDVELYYSSVSGTGDAVNFDVVLFEGPAGDVEIRYYTVGVPTGTNWLSVGIQGDDIDAEEAVIMTNNVLINAAIAASYSNSTLKLSYTGQTVDSAVCGGLGYNMTALRNTQLVYNVSTSVSYVVNICNIVRDPVCSNSPLTDRSMLCRRSDSGTALTLASIGEWNPSEVFWRYGAGNTGVQLVSQTGAYCSNAQQPYTTILNFVCSATATTPTITGITESPTCFVTVNITTSLACGAGDRNQPVPPVRSTLQTCLTVTGNLYNANWCPRAANDPLNTPETLTSPQNILVNDNGAAIATLGFNFTIYGRQENQVSISTNGMLTFGYSAHSSATNGPFPSMGLTTDHYPAIAPFFTDLVNQYQTTDPLPYTGAIQVSWMGASPNRRFVIRYREVDYFSTRNSLAAQSATFDVILYESNTGSRIETRFYKIDPAPQNVVIGMHGYGNDYTAVTNFAPVSRVLGGQLSGSTLTYTFTGTTTIDMCNSAPGGINLASLSGRDLNFNTSSYAFYVRPCGTVSASLCVNRYSTSRVSVCQATFDGTNSWALANDNPTATVYTMVGSTTVRATTRDGLVCGANPRITIIDYVCNPNATTAYIDQQSENPGCTYNFRVQTAVTCVTPFVVGGTGPSIYYDAQIGVADDTPLFKPTLTNPTAIMAAGDDNTQVLNIPFPVRIFGNTTSQITASVNGFITLAGTSPGGIPSTSFPYAYSFTPMLAVWATDLHNSNRVGTAGIFWSVEGTAPNRVFVLRWNEVNYYATRQSASTASDSLLTFDVRFYESTNYIDVQYWQIGPYAQSVGVGLQGMTGATTVLISGQTYAARGLVLEGRTVRYMVVTPVSSSSTGVAVSSSSSSTAIPAPTSQPTSSTRSSSSSSVPSSSSSTAAPVATSSARSSSTASPSVSSSARSSSSSAPASSSPNVARSSSSSNAVVTPTAQPSSSSIPDIIGDGSSSSSSAGVGVIDDSSTSSDLSNGAIAGIVVGSVIGALLLCLLVAAMCFGLGRGTKGNTRLDDDGSMGHSSTDVEMA